MKKFMMLHFNCVEIYNFQAKQQVFILQTDNYKYDPKVKRDVSKAIDLCRKYF